jgi:hypothetical protein
MIAFPKRDTKLAVYWLHDPRNRDFTNIRPLSMEDLCGWAKMSNVILDVSGLTRLQLREHFEEACQNEIGSPHMLSGPVGGLEEEYCGEFIVPITRRVCATILTSTNLPWKDDMGNWLWVALKELAPYRIRRWITAEKCELRRSQDSQRIVTSSSGLIHPSSTGPIQSRNGLERNADTVTYPEGVERSRQSIAFLLNAPEHDSLHKGRAPGVTIASSISRSWSKGRRHLSRRVIIPEDQSGMR